MIKLIKALALCALTVCPSAFSEPTQEEIAAAEEKLSQSFANYQITDFKPTPIPGIFEVHAGPQVHYYAPEQKILIFGQMWSAEGENLTQKSKQESVAAKRDSLPLDTAITVSEGEIPILEIMNPDCGYCQRYEAWVTKLESVYSIERKVVFFDTEGFPAAGAKMRGVICSDDPAKGYHDMMAGQTSPANCEQASDIMASHNEITNAIGVQGTPTFLLADGRVITGFRPKELEEYFIKKSTED